MKIVFFLLTEHMLFYASEKYPVEDSYSKYITEVPEVLYVRFFQGKIFHIGIFLPLCMEARLPDF